jgi:hypothetical protein
MAEVKPGRWTAVIGARASRNLRRSCEHLERFANDRDDPHVAAWRNYWKRVGKDTRTGIWHETYLVRAGEYEAVYGDMPPWGWAGPRPWFRCPTSARARLKRRSST